jgi:hypothetical protein
MAYSSSGVIEITSDENEKTRRDGLVHVVVLKMRSGPGRVHPSVRGTAMPAAVEAVGIENQN